VTLDRAKHYSNEKKSEVLHM